MLGTLYSPISGSEICKLWIQVFGEIAVVPLSKVLKNESENDHKSFKIGSTKEPKFCSKTSCFQTKTDGTLKSS